MFALLLIAITSRRCYKISRCPPHMKGCGEEDRLDIKICGAKKAHIIEPKAEENLMPPHKPWIHEPHFPKPPRRLPMMEEEENKWNEGPWTPSPYDPRPTRPIYYEENGGSGNVKCSYNSRGEWQCGVEVGITW